MKKDELFNVISDIDDNLIKEAQTKNFINPRTLCLKITAAAAGVLLLVGISFIANKKGRTPQVDLGTDSSQQAGGLTGGYEIVNRSQLIYEEEYELLTEEEIESQSSAADTSSDKSGTNKALCYLNPAQEVFTGALNLEFGKEHTAVTYNQKKLTEYFKKDLTPPYIPNGLYASEKNYEQRFFESGNEITFDTAFMEYYTAFDDNGNPTQEKNKAYEVGFTLAASKKESYIFAAYKNDEVISTYMGRYDKGESVPVIFGVINKEKIENHGEVTSKTNYKVYTAEFSLCGIYYSLKGTGLSIADFVKVVHSIILDEPSDERYGFEGIVDPSTTSKKIEDSSSYPSVPAVTPNEAYAASEAIIN